MEQKKVTLRSSEQMTTTEKETAPTLQASKFNEPTSQDDIPPPSENASLVQPPVTDLHVQAVGPTVENPNKWKHHNYDP